MLDNLRQFYLNPISLIITLFGLLIFSEQCFAKKIKKNKLTWPVWVSELREEAITQGIEPDLFDELFENIRPNRRVVKLDRSQPEKRLTFLEYRRTRGDNYRIKIGKREYRKHRHLIDEVADEYGVKPSIIVALWGIESSYGRFMGKHSVIKSLATLAYDSRRSQFFRKELLQALHIINDGHIDADEFVGEWAGGSGQPQFLPSSWHAYAVDYNNDGRRDIWKTRSDVFASIANYLVENGWQTGQPTHVEVMIPGGFDETLVGYDTTLPLSTWRQQGVIVIDDGINLPDSIEASLVRPHGGPDYLVFKNFRVIMQYNRSTFYAATVAYMAQKIANR